MSVINRRRLLAQYAMENGQYENRILKDMACPSYSK